MPTSARRSIGRSNIAASSIEAQDVNVPRNLRSWKNETRGPSTPLPVPDRIGSINSGGVGGFGFLRPEIKVDPVRRDVPAGAPALQDPANELMTPGRPWWERDRFKSSFVEPIRPITKRAPSPVSINLTSLKLVRQLWGMIFLFLSVAFLLFSTSFNSSIYFLNLHVSLALC